MEEKKVEKKKFRKSISKKTLFSILLMALLLSLTSIVIGYTVYSTTMDAHYISTTNKLALTTAELVDKDVVEKYGQMIYERYIEISDKLKEDQWEEEYRSLFDDIEEFEDFQELKATLRKIRESNDVMYVYIMFIDKANSVCIYVADGETDEENYSPPGAWEPISIEQANSLSQGNDAVITNEPEFGWLSSGGSPIYANNDGTFAAAIVDISMNKVMQDRYVFLRNYCGILIAVTALLCVVMTASMRRQVVVPVNKLAKAASDYSANAGKDAEMDKDKKFFSDLNIKTGDELENLSIVMNGMEEKLKEYIENLTKVTAEKERIGAELNIATQIQADMLPRIFPAFPHLHEFDLYATMHPAKEVGGDFYDFFLVDDDHIALVMADVSGKGVPAALFMVIAKTLIKNRAQLGESPSEILKNVNNQLCEGNEAELFVTVWLAIIEISTGKGVAANAGHEHPVICRKDGKYELVVYRHSPAVATFEGLKFKEHEFVLNPGDKLFVYTDGVPEATNANNELFGTDRMLESLNNSLTCTPKEVLENMRNSIVTFVGDAPQFDDITMLAFNFYGSGEKEDELVVDANVDELSKVLEFIDTRLDNLDCPMKTHMHIDVAVEELFVNIAHYAYKPGNGNVTVKFKKSENPLLAEITFIDSGVPYDPLAKKDPDITLSAEDRPIGGLGIFMVKKSMDDIVYEYADGKNILKIKKIIE